MTPWELKGRELINCTCEYGCNCQFNALPDKGHCHAVAGIAVDSGHFGDTRLDGLNIAAIFKWPGAIHEGNGEAMAFVDERADDAQREGLLKIMSGQDTDPFATVFAVFASTLTKMHDPVFARIDVAIDVEGRKGRVAAPGHLEIEGRPIVNPVSGAEHRAQIVLPDGFEYEVAEIGSASSRTHGPVVVRIEDKYAQFAYLHMNNHGLIRSRPRPAGPRPADLSAPPDSSPLEALLRRERAVTAAGLALLCALAWVYLARGAGMGQPMDMAAMSAMAPEPATMAWDRGRWAMAVVMWASMMVAMMTPAAAPTVLLYARVARHSAAQGGTGGRVAPPWAFAAGYFVVWTAFSVVAAVLHWGLEVTGLLAADSMSSQSKWLSAGVLAAAGIYQFTPWQAVCLGHCRAPASFLSRHWRPGLGGAVRLGVLHGAYCVGCCWLIMALLFVGGVMNLAWIAGIAVLVLAERLLPGGPWIARAAGLALLGWATAILLA